MYSFWPTYNRNAYNLLQSLTEKNKSCLFLKYSYIFIFLYQSMKTKGHLVLISIHKKSVEERGYNTCHFKHVDKATHKIALRKGNNDRFRG